MGGVTDNVTAEVGGLGSGGGDGQCDSRGRRPGEWGG